MFYIFKCCLKLFVVLLVWRETNFEIYHRSYRPGWKWRTITWLQSRTRLIHDEMCDRLHPLSVLKTTLACCGHIPNKNIWSYSIHIHFYVQHIYHIQLVKLFIMLSICVSVSNIYKLQMGFHTVISGYAVYYHYFF